MKILNYLFLSFICSLFYTFISFFIMYVITKITKKDDELESFGNIWGTLYIVNMIMFFLIFAFFRVDDSNNIVENQTSQIEELQTELDLAEDKLERTQSELEEKKNELTYAEDLVVLLQEQLYSYGIEPDEL